MTKVGRKLFNLRISEKLHEALREVSQAEGLTMSEIVRGLIADFLKKRRR